MTEPRGFQFPGTFEVTAFVEAGADPVAAVLAQLAAAELAPRRDSVSQRPSREGKFVAVRVALPCETREQLERAHAKLREHPAIKWTL
jgi:putative lipoic acid-binding regulatory protein